MHTNCYKLPDTLHMWQLAHASTDTHTHKTCMQADREQTDTQNYMYTSTETDN